MDNNILTVSEVAKLLGLHPNTIRYRIKKGSISASKILSPQGEMAVISRAELDRLLDLEPQTNQATNNVLAFKDGGSNRELVGSSNGLDLEAVAKRFVAPFVARLEETNRALGRVEAERDYALECVKALEEELAALRASQDPDSEGEKPRSWWRRLFAAE